MSTKGVDTSSSLASHPFEVFKADIIIKNFPFEIECIYAYDDYLMVGTKQGHLLIYRFELKKSSSSNEIKLIPEIMRTNKCFSRKPITQLEALPEFDIFLCLSDSQITAHNLLEMDSPIIKCDLLAKCRGATMFVTNIQRLQGMGGEEKAVLRLCVVIKKRISLFYWKNKSFCELKKDLQLPDIPKAISWIGESLFIGFKSEYLLLKVTGEQKGLFQCGKHPEPLISAIDSCKNVVLCRDEKSYVLDHQGNPILSYEIVWSECPIALVDDMPYLVSLLSNSSLQVLSMNPRINVQKLNDITHSRSRIKSLVKTINRRGRLFACSNSDIICIKAIPYPSQIAQMLKEKEFRLARILTDLAADLPDSSSPMASSLSLISEKSSSSLSSNLRDGTSLSSGYETERTTGHPLSFKKEETMKHIENLEAFEFFCRKQFPESMSMFAKLGTDPILVIGLFPNLLPESCKAKVELQYPSTPPSLNSIDLKSGLKSLVDYLLNYRRSLMHGKNGGNIYLRQMIDTTLLKCYLETQPAFVAPLLRLGNSQCILEDSEAALIAHNKSSELILLYQSKGLHRKALEKMLAEPSSFTTQQVIRYLQELPKDQLDLVFEYSVPILRSTPTDGLKIFTEEIGSETEELPRERVLEFIQSTNEDLIIPYLEYIINTWNDQSPHFHNLLIYKLREKVMKNLPSHRGRSNSGSGSHASQIDSVEDVNPDDSWASLRPESPAAGKEPGELGYYRKKLLKFLRKSKYYATEVLEGHFKNDEMWPELALVKGKSGDHKAALDIYINTMQDIELAIKYCDRLYKNYEKENDTSSNVTLTVASEKQLEIVQNVYHILIELLLKSNLHETALSIVNKHPQRVNACQVMKILPDSTSLKSISDFLSRSIVEKLQTRRFGQIYRSLLMSQFIEVQGQRVRLQQSHRVVIDDSDLCTFCQKRIGKSAFLQYPNSHLIHYSCKDIYNQSS